MYFSRHFVNSDNLKDISLLMVFTWSTSVQWFQRYCLLNVGVFPPIHNVHFVKNHSQQKKTPAIVLYSIIQLYKYSSAFYTAIACGCFQNGWPVKRIDHICKVTPNIMFDIGAGSCNQKV